MDKPTYHLDCHYQLELLKFVRSPGNTALIMFHDLNLAVAYCDLFYLIREDSLVTSGSSGQAPTGKYLKDVFL